jgi:hypothetical protein
MIKKHMSEIYKVKAQVWKYEGPNGWYFVSVPQVLSKEIRELHKESEEGWGRLKSEVCIESLRWKTSIWFDTKLDCFLVPIKAEVRKKLGITDGSEVSLNFSVKT